MPKFKEEAMDLIGADEIDELANYLSEHPRAGDVIPNAGGVRKLRWRAAGRGKRGGTRVIYLYVVVDQNIYLLRCYSKNVQADLSANEKKQVRELAARLKGTQ